MLRYIIAACVLIAVVVLIYYFCIYTSDRARRRRAERLYQRSAGVFDAAAREALEELNQLRVVRPEDRFRRATLLEYNILEGDNERDHGIVRQVAEDYTGALQGMREQDWYPAAPEFVLRQVRDFRDELHRIDDDLAIDIALALAETEPIVLTRTIEDRRERAKTQANNQVEAMTGFLDESIVYTSDAQNVHDSNVNSDLRRVHTILSASNTGTMADAFVEARRYIERVYPGSAEKRANALATLDKMSRGGRIMTYNDTEDHIFAVVWHRTNDPANVGNENLMKEAVANALADCIENGSMVCINGRCARILNALVTLDHDPEVSAGAMTYEAYRNQIFSETQDIIKRIVDDYGASTDAAKRKLAASYKGENVEVSAETEEEFKAEAQRAIAANIHRYDTKLSPEDIRRITGECFAALD